MAVSWSSSAHGNDYFSRERQRIVDKYSIPQRLGSVGQRPFHVMAKPAGSTCNLDCKYCFYLGKERLPKGPGTGEMSDETLDLFIRQYITGVTGPEIVFS